MSSSVNFKEKELERVGNVGIIICSLEDNYSVINRKIHGTNFDSIGYYKYNKNFQDISVTIVGLFDGIYIKIPNYTSGISAFVNNPLVREVIIYPCKAKYENDLLSALFNLVYFKSTEHELCNKYKEIILSLISKNKNHIYEGEKYINDIVQKITKSKEFFSHSNIFETRIYLSNRGTKKIPKEDLDTARLFVSVFLDLFNTNPAVYNFFINKLDEEFDIRMIIQKGFDLNYLPVGIQDPFLLKLIERKKSSPSFIDNKMEQENIIRKFGSHQRKIPHLVHNLTKHINTTITEINSGKSVIDLTYLVEALNCLNTHFDLEMVNVSGISYLGNLVINSEITSSGNTGSNSDIILIPNSDSFNELNDVELYELNKYLLKLVRVESKYQALLESVHREISQRQI